MTPLPLSPLIDQLLSVLLARPDVEAVTMFGSRARTEGRDADAGSDIDLQVVSREPSVLADSGWAESVLPAQAIVAWNVRAAFGGVQKLSVVLRDGEADIVVVPAKRMRLARWAVRFGIHQRNAKLRRQLGDIKLVMAGGFRVLKGGAAWQRFYDRVVAEVPEPGLSDAEVRNLVAGATVDLISIRRKLARGELRAAQRWLHTGLAETNFRLLHEWRRRRCERTYHDGRRAELYLPEDELVLVSVSAELDREALERAAESAETATRRLAAALLNEANLR